MRDKVILEIGGTLKSVPDCYKDQEMCKAVDTNPWTIQFVPEYYKTEAMCYKAVHIYVFLYLILFLINIKLKEYVT